MSLGARNSYIEGGVAPIDGVDAIVRDLTVLRTAYKAGKGAYNSGIGVVRVVGGAQRWTESIGVGNYNSLTV